jgi:hypothetical protein
MICIELLCEEVFHHPLQKKGGFRIFLLKQSIKLPLKSQPALGFIVKIGCVDTQEKDKEHDQTGSKFSGELRSWKLKNRKKKNQKKQKIDPSQKQVEMIEKEVKGEPASQKNDFSPPRYLRHQKRTQ